MEALDNTKGEGESGEPYTGEMASESIAAREKANATNNYSDSRGLGIVKLWKCCKCRQTGRLPDSFHSPHCRGDDCFHEWCESCDSYLFDLADNHIKPLPKRTETASLRKTISPTSSLNQLETPSSEASASQTRKRINAKGQLKHRYETKKSLEELKEIVPELRHGGHTKADALRIAADYVRDVEEGNEALRAQVRELEAANGRERVRKADEEFRDYVEEWEREIRELRARVLKLEEAARRNLVGGEVR